MRASAGFDTSSGCRVIGERRSIAARFVALVGTRTPILRLRSFNFFIRLLQGAARVAESIRYRCRTSAQPHSFGDGLGDLLLIGHAVESFGEMAPDWCVQVERRPGECSLPQALRVRHRFHRLDPEQRRLTYLAGHVGCFWTDTNASPPLFDGV